MDPPPEGFDELERAFREADFLAFEHKERDNARPHRHLLPAPRSVPTTYAHIPSSESEGASPDSSDDGHERFDVTTPPPRERHGLTRHNSGLPPTPPTMTNSDIAEPQPDPDTDHSPLFADRVRTALEGHKSGHSTPVVMGNISPPTPETSPPVLVEALLPPQPDLSHYPSSHGESFKTAREASSRAPSRSASKAPVHRDETTPRGGTPTKKSETLRPALLAGFGSSRQERSHDILEDSDFSEARVRVKNYQIESDSEVERAISYLAGDAPSSADEATVAPTPRSVLNHRAAYQRLWRPLQPGDDVKRPDSALIYGSLVSKPVTKPATKPAAKSIAEPVVEPTIESAVEQAVVPAIEPAVVPAVVPAVEPAAEPDTDVEQRTIQPRREMDMEFLRNADLLSRARISTPNEVAATTEMWLEDDTPQLQAEPESHDPAPSKLREFAPLEAPPEIPSPPTTAAKQSLEDNNQVYRLIQEENVKRHSGISDGIGVPAVVLPFPEQKHKLRHTTKRESLRTEAGISANESRSNADNGNRLRHKRGMAALGGPERIGVRVASAQHELHSNVDGLPSLGPREQKSRATSAPSSYPKLSARISRVDADADPYYYGLPDTNTRVDERLARGSSRSRRPPHDQRPSSVTPNGRQDLGKRHPHSLEPVRKFDRRESSAIDAAVATETSTIPADFRRPLSAIGAKLVRNSSMDSRPQTSTGIRRDWTPRSKVEDRPLSIDASTLQQLSAPSRLKRSSKGERLENNMEVRRTSLSRQFPMTASQLSNNNLQQPAPDLIGEKRDLLEPTLAKEPRPVSYRSASSAKRRSFDPRFLHASGTPFSSSQFSDRTALTEPEVLEARQIGIYPHNNKSLLLIQQPSRPPEVFSGRENAPPLAIPTVIEEPFDSIDHIGTAKHTVDSPLTNPREAPEPPIIKFIPPTPLPEPDQQSEATAGNRRDARPEMSRRTSLKQKARRFSEGMIQPLPFGRHGSMRKARAKAPLTQAETRPTHLSSFWQPRNFWENYDSDSDRESDENDFEPLPPGGDTSDVIDTDLKQQQRQQQQQRRLLLPRNMSVRMPGFRGAGGFLVGNSLGIARHGTNNRRHYVEKRRSTSSEEMLRRLAAADRSRSRGQKSSRQFFSYLPFSSRQADNTAGSLDNRTAARLPGFTNWLRDSRRSRAARQLERRRDRLRGQIGTRVYHVGPPAVAAAGMQPIRHPFPGDSG